MKIIAIKHVRRTKSGAPFFYLTSESVPIKDLLFYIRKFFDFRTAVIFCHNLAKCSYFLKRKL